MSILGDCFQLALGFSNPNLLSRPRIYYQEQFVMASTEHNSENRNGNTAKPSQIRDVFFFPHVRTISHVLCRLLSGQPGWAPQSDYHFKRAFDFARESFNWGPLRDVPDPIRKKFEALLQEGFDEIQHDRRSAHNDVGYFLESNLSSVEC